VLVGLLLPAVQKTRESAARTSCTNNLTQLIKAAHSYESANMQFPPGLDTQMVGPFVRMLPYLEQEGQAARFRLTPTPPTPTMPNPTGYWADPQNRPPTGSTIPTPAPEYGAAGNFKVFRCPTAPPPESMQTVILFVTSFNPSNPAFGADTEFPTPTGAAQYSTSGAPGDGVMGRTNYVANAGYPRNALSTGSPPQPLNADGPFRYNRNAGTKVGAVLDGLSNTIFFMESAGGELINTTAMTTTRLSHTWANGLYLVQYGVCPHGATGSTGTSWTGNCTNFRPLIPNSKHAGDLINAAFGDGSVRPVRTSTFTFTHWVVLNGINEGFVNPTDF
jgi:hypothetical protein